MTHIIINKIPSLDVSIMGPTWNKLVLLNEELSKIKPNSNP